VHQVEEGEGPDCGLDDEEDQDAQTEGRVFGHVGGWVVGWLIVEVAEVAEEGVEKDKCRRNIQARSKAIPDRRDKRASRLVIDRGLINRQ
jgi:hypothetical protein